MTVMPIVAGYGTSVFEGYGGPDNDPYYVLALDAASTPYIRLGKGGSAAGAEEGIGHHEVRDAIATIATDFLCEHFVNDAHGTGVTFTGVATVLHTRYQQLYNIGGGGKRVWPCTPTPSYSSSTDGWTTLAGQTPNASIGVLWAQIRDWQLAKCPLLSGTPVAPGTPGSAPSPYVYDTFDVGAAVTVIDGGLAKWKVVGGPYTKDGTHPADLGHRTMAAAMDIGRIWTAAGITPPASPPPPPPSTGLLNLQKLGGSLVRL